jgi:hypothetical protein
MCANYTLRTNRCDIRGEWEGDQDAAQPRLGSLWYGRSQRLANRSRLINVVHVWPSEGDLAIQSSPAVSGKL